MQITVGVVGCLVIIAGFATYQYFQRYSAQPQALMARLQAVSTQTATLSENELGSAIIADVRTVIRSELMTQLALTEMPDPEQGASAILDEALEFTEDDTALVEWVNRYLQNLALPQEQTVMTDTGSASRKIIQSPEGCLVIERQSGRWRLSSLLGCQTGDGVGLENG